MQATAQVRATDGPSLGLVCITASQEIRYRTITRKRLLTFSTSERRQVLHDLYGSNIAVLRRAIDFCRTHHICLYRLSSSLFPFSDEPYGARVLESFSPRLQEIGRAATRQGIRLVLHPDQYVVLNSDSESVIANSIKILTAQALMLDALDQPRTPWSAIQLHGGKGGRGRRLVEVIGGLEEGIRRRLALENDEYAFGSQEILDICGEARVPMVFDAHHHLVHDRLSSYEDPSMAQYVQAAAKTWPKPGWQLVHISNGRTGLLDASHSDLIHVLPSAYRQVPYIEVEAKAKEEAIALIRRQWTGSGSLSAPAV